MPTKFDVLVWTGWPKFVKVGYHPDNARIGCAKSKPIVLALVLGLSAITILIASHPATNIREYSLSQKLILAFA